ncbi:LytTR family DNA-binding domain-containing protein [Lachnoclostridium sp. Marseille-P6806]|uniref:LytTR family DNA-binding domain-containing protein n=1 Tax=Lachnoclostridium sp. Marseille-P6806 TaxID=2364793 RepID=UPI0010306DD3|nr:LytTR family DNA-binding domain-containing protein [Lachnoclostridium sp. Marseille-P6806]
MKVSMELSKEYVPPYAVIYADKVTDEIRQALELLKAADSPVIGQQEDKMAVIKPDEIYMVRAENGKIVIYTEKESYCSGKRLYELRQQLGSGFMQISKQSIIRLSYIESVEAGFGGSLALKLKNGLRDYVSRKYLPLFKEYLGL